MKKALTLIAAAIAAIVLCSAAVLEAGGNLSGTVTVESSALNFSISADRAGSIYNLMPEAVTEACSNAYREIRHRCSSSDDFTYEGVRVQMAGRDSGTMSLTFSVQGCKVHAEGLSWTELDALFLGPETNR